MRATTAAVLDWFDPSAMDVASPRTASVRALPVLIRQLRERTSAARDPLIYELHQRLDRLESLKDNWDGYGSMSPNKSAVEQARQFLEEIRRNAGWQAPHISASEAGEIVFEWWSGDRKLTIYIGAESLAYVKSWGPNLEDEMEDGPLTGDEFLHQWAWLFG